ncbi:MAG TPA: hypothetical protein VHF25_09835 [Nitriliruptorales bacterium]|nr:hypothetical protein [Nitriliruptorales bacterium]
MLVAFLLDGFAIAAQTMIGTALGAGDVRGARGWARHGWSPWPARAERRAFVLDGVLMGASHFAFLRTWTVAAAVVAAVLGQLAASRGWGIVGLWGRDRRDDGAAAAARLTRLRGGRWAHPGAA